MTTATIPERLVYPIPEVQELLGGVSERFVYSLIYANKIQRVKVGRRTMIPREDVESYVKSILTK